MNASTDDGPVVGIYRQDESDDVEGCTIIEHMGGHKRFARVWDLRPDEVDWGWTLHPSAVRVWPRTT